MKGISFYLIATERVLLEIDSFKGIADPVKKSLSGRPEHCFISRWVVTCCSACPLRMGFSEH